MQTITNRNQQLGWTLLGVAGLVLLSTINGAVEGFFWVGAVALGFFYAYRQTGQHGLVVPAGILAGISAGILLQGITPFDGIFLVGFAAGFWGIKFLEPQHHAWAQYPAWVFTAIAGIIFVSANAWLVALALVGLGVYLLGKQSKTLEIQQPQPTKLERLTQWRAEVAQKAGLVEPEILRGEQLERLAKMTPENVDAMFGVLDAAQIERYGKTLLGVLS